MRLVECVPNFSEGRNPATIDAIAAVIREAEGAWLLDVDPGKATNRTVVTFVAEYDHAVDAAFRAIERAASLIDMAAHSGEHARMGATDVCPFVPVRGVTMDECADLARELGRRVGDELGIPVYLYEHAASRKERRNLATIRAGEYEGLEKKLTDPEWQPDFGPARFNPRSGATVIGARKFLIAYNINLNTRSRKLAHDVAMSIREAGRNKRGSDGKFVRDKNGVPVRQPGTLRACKAVGWYIAEYGRAQISMNLTDFDVTPPHVAFDECVRQASARGLRVTGSELVGLIPLEAMLQAGHHYLESQGASPGIPQRDIVETAIQSLGLRELSSFDPAEKIIEYRVAQPGPLIGLPLRDFVDVTSTDAPAPGGGSVAALAGALAGALAAMVANLTIGKKGYGDARDEMMTIAVDGQKLKEEMLRAIDADTQAFDAVLAAMRLPRTTDDESRERARAIEDATKRAIDVPLGVLRRCRDTIGIADAASQRGNANSRSDSGVAALCAWAGAGGALMNVLTNLPGVSDTAYVRDVMNEARNLSGEVNARGKEIIERVVSELEANAAESAS